jgi:hypothetical protein
VAGTDEEQKKEEGRGYGHPHLQRAAFRISPEVLVASQTISWDFTMTSTTIRHHVFTNKKKKEGVVRDPFTP